MGILYVGMTLLPLTYQSLFATLDEHMVRPLIFPIWLPKDDPHRTPNYEIFLFLQLALVLLYMKAFGFYVYIQFHVLLHNKVLLELIIMDFDTLFDGLDEFVAMLPNNDMRRIAVQHTLNKRLERIVTWHNSVFK
ncbi:hypothetical protein evm_012496 [Chilo suppressalis]|nr:hypothetical protein evm_012496 [Chilo suppressalis]